MAETAFFPQETQSDQPAQVLQPFDADKLLNEHKESVVRIRKDQEVFGNKLDQTLGSGFTIDKLENDKEPTVCRIATDNHVIAGETAPLILRFEDGKDYPAEVEIIDAANDLAILKVADASGALCKPLAISDQEHATTPGEKLLKISGKYEKPVAIDGEVESYFQRDQAKALAMLPGENETRTMLSVKSKAGWGQTGDSGGPIINANGVVVGIIDAEGNAVTGATPSHYLAKDLNMLHSSDKRF